MREMAPAKSASHDVIASEQQLADLIRQIQAADRVATRYRGRQPAFIPGKTLFDSNQRSVRRHPTVEVPRNASGSMRIDLDFA